MSQSINYCFTQALDVLFLRGNKLFGDPGSFGESLIPPWPSVAAGAMRTRMLVDAGVDLARFARGLVDHPSLGTPERPGPFTITHFGLGRLDTSGQVETLTLLPNDIVVTEDIYGKPQASLLQPQAAGRGIQSSAQTPLLPILAQRDRSKASSGYWLNAAGFEQYLAGNAPGQNHLVSSSKLWSLDTRVGVGLDSRTRSAEDGKLFSTQAVCLRPDIGFVIGALGGSMPVQGVLRLGGDGRAMAIHPAAVTPPALAPLDQIVLSQRARLILTSPGIFESGWLPPGVSKDSSGAWRVALPGFNARLVAAAVSRAETISGWDLARNQPKPAQLAAPTGSVYWLDQIQTTSDALRKLADSGLWDASSHTESLHFSHASRRAEGFNRFTWAVWL